MEKGQEISTDPISAVSIIAALFTLLLVCIIQWGPPMTTMNGNVKADMNMDHLQWMPNHVIGTASGR